jgi:hypothetical protein
MIKTRAKQLYVSSNNIILIETIKSGEETHFEKGIKEDELVE